MGWRCRAGISRPSPNVSRLFAVSIVPDLPGFGRSEKPPHILTIAGMADALADWMRVVGLKRAVILGHSLGCQVAARFAARYPEMTLGVILVSPTMDPDDLLAGVPAARAE